MIKSHGNWVSPTTLGSNRHSEGEQRVNDSRRTGALAGAMYKVIATDQSWHGSTSDLALLLSRRFGLPMDEVREALQRNGELQVASQVSEQDAELLRNVLARIGVNAKLEELYPVTLDADDACAPDIPAKDVTVLDMRGQSQLEVTRPRPDEPQHTMLQWSRRSNSESSREAMQETLPSHQHTPQQIHPLSPDGPAPPESLNTVLDVSHAEQGGLDERPRRSFSEEIADIWGGVIAPLPTRDSGEQLVRAPRSSDTVISDDALPALAPDLDEAPAVNGGWGAVLNQEPAQQTLEEDAPRSPPSNENHPSNHIISRQVDVTDQWTIIPESTMKLVNVTQDSETDPLSNSIDIMDLQALPEPKATTPPADPKANGEDLTQETQAATTNLAAPDKDAQQPFEMPRLEPLPETVTHTTRATPPPWAPSPEMMGKDSAAHARATPSTNPDHDPRMAALLSALMPGAGQVYNGQWSKACLYGLSCWLIVPWLLGVRDAWRTGQDIASGMLSPMNVGEGRRVALYGVIWVPLFVLMITGFMRAGERLLPNDTKPSDAQLKTAVITARGEALFSFERALYRAEKAQALAGEALTKSDGQDARTPKERKRYALKELSKARAACGRRQYIQCRHFAQLVVDAQTESRLAGEAIKLMTEANKGLQDSAGQNNEAPPPKLFDLGRDTRPPSSPPPGEP